MPHSAMSGSPSSMPASADASKGWDSTTSTRSDPLGRLERSTGALYNESDHIVILNFSSHCIKIGTMKQPARLPGRPRDPRLNHALLEAGLAVFLESGYGAASLSEIARRAGVGTPAIYRRWPTKTDLAIAIIEH